MQRHLILFSILASTLSAATVTITVDATSEIWAANLPPSSTSPVLALTGFQTGTAITFSTSSDCGFAYAGGCGPYGATDNSADGNQTSGGSTSARNGISGLTTSWNSLVGVFLTDSAPALSPAPADLDHLSVAARSFASLSPLLQQSFFVGDGLTGRGTGSTQTFFAPAGATRLFLGSMDGSGWFNNTGSQTVQITYTPSDPSEIPEPSSWMLIAGGSGLLAMLRRRR